MGQDTGQIRQDIEETRGRMGETVEALGYKADVPGRAKEAVSGRVESVKSKISGATPDSGDVRQGAHRAKGVAQENPLGLALGGVAVGFVAGLIVPSTRVEDEKIGPIADQVKEKAKETAQEAGREHADGLRGSAHEKTQAAQDEIRR